jgi:hypothetical protein
MMKKKILPANELPANCSRCPHWQLNVDWAYKVCVLSNIAGSPKKLPKECPLRGKHDAAVGAAYAGG